MQRIHETSKLIDFVRCTAVTAEAELMVNRSLFEGKLTISLWVNNQLIAEMRKLPESCVNEAWDKIYKSDYNFVNEAAFRKYSNNSAWLAECKLDNKRLFEHQQRGYRSQRGVTCRA